jgi:predicted acyl esterase
VLIGRFLFVVVKVTDVWKDPLKKDPTSMLVQDGIVRMRWREGPSATTPTPMTPGTVYQVTVSLGPTSYVSPAHR